VAQWGGMVAQREAWWLNAGGMVAQHKRHGGSMGEAWWLNGEGMMAQLGGMVAQSGGMMAHPEA
jgi:hypothetical protein